MIFLLLPHNVLPDIELLAVAGDDLVLVQPMGADAHHCHVARCVILKIRKSENLFPHLIFLQVSPDQHLQSYLSEESL